MGTDAVVLGAGTAGMVAALRLAVAGASVLVLAEGQGGLPLAPAQIDVLGYRPQLVLDPVGEIPGFLESRPDHPYRLVEAAEVEAGLDWFLELAAPLGYTGNPHQNRLQPTAVGALRPTCLVPETMAAGDLSDGGSVLVVGLKGFRDFHAPLLAENLALARPPSGAEVRARSVEVSLLGDPRDLRPQLLVRRLEERPVLAELGREIRSRLEQEDLVGVPAVLGLERSHEVWQRLQELVGRPVFEIPTPPPSQPGQRLQQHLFRALRRLGGEVRLGARASGYRASGDRLVAVKVVTAAREVEIPADRFVLATGGIGTGGITVGPEGELREEVFGARVSRGGAPEEPLVEYLATQPLDRLGVEVDDEQRPLGKTGGALFENLWVAGAALAGAEPWREKSGEGISLATGYRAARLAGGRRA
ncbi:MAG: anaerobic glycerol-3-phosphate dehydrogenase subunit GlpB [Candidatus Dormibacteraeota bacterium]|nr:anaerobic glycerol-3-phosphate dehydrogenase subunit GlpB [Candidatus Dormibacteraeota bacterium]